MKKAIGLFFILFIFFGTMFFYFQSPFLRVIMVIGWIFTIVFWFHLLNIVIEDNSLRELAKRHSKNLLFLLFVCTTAVGFYMANDRYEKLTDAFFEYVQYNQGAIAELRGHIDSNHALIDNLYDIKKIDPNIPEHLKGKITIW